MLEDPARGADGDVGAKAQGGGLWCGRGAAAQGDQLDVGQGAGETADLGGNLIGQLASRTEHQRLHLEPVDIEVGKQAEAEGRGLAAAGFCLGDQVFAIEYRGQTLGWIGVICR